MLSYVCTYVLTYSFLTIAIINVYEFLAIDMYQVILIGQPSCFCLANFEECKWHVCMYHYVHTYVAMSKIPLHTYTYICTYVCQLY